MKKLILNYTFNASTKSITFNDYSSINLAGILSIKNITRNVVIYILNSSNSSARVTGNRFIYEGDFPSFRNSDVLQIWYVDNTPDPVPDPIVGSIIAGTSTATLGQIIFSNTNGVSFGANGQIITASVAPAGGLVNFSAGTTSNSLTNLVFSNGNGVSFGLDGSTITASVGAGGVAGSISAGTTSVALGEVVFSNSNGISFGLNGSTITAQHNALTSQSNQAISGSNGSFTFQTLTLGNLNGASFYSSNGSVVASYTVPSTTGLISRINISAGTTSNNLTNFVLSNSNGLSFGLNGSTITGSYTQVTDYISIGESTNFLLSDAGSDFIYSSAGLNLTNVSATLGSNSLSFSVAAQSTQPVAASASNGSFVFSTLNFVETNGVTWATSTDGIRASVETNYQSPGAYLTTAMASNRGSDFVQATAAFAGTNATGTIASDGISVSVNAQSTVPQNISLYGLGNTTQNSSTILSVNALSFNAIGSLTVGYSNGSIQLSAPNALTTAMASNRGSDFVQATAAFAGTNATGTIASSGISVSVNAQSSVPQNASLYALGNTTQNSSTVLSLNALSFNGLGAATVGYSNGSIQVSVPTQTVDTGKAGTGFTSAGNNIGLSGTLNTNGLSLSATVAAQSNQNISLYGLGNTTQNSSTVLNASNLSFNAIGSLTVGYSNGSIQLSAPNALTSQSNQIASADNGSYAFQTLSFSNANGVSFGTSAGSAITASHNGLTSQSNQNISLYALGNTTQNSSTLLNASNLSFNGLGNATVGFSNGSIQISVTGGGGGAAISADANSQNTGTVNFSNSNGISFGLSNDGVMTASHNGLTSQSNQAFSAGAASSTFQTLSFQDSNGISFSNNAGAIRLTHDLQYTSNTSAITSNALHSSASRVFNIVAATDNTGGGVASLSSNVSFSNANAISFYTSAGGAIVGSVNTSYRASNDAIGLNTAQSNVTWTANSAGLSLDGRGYAGTGTTFNGANMSGSITQNSNGLQLSLSVAAPGAAAENNWVHLLGANTAGNTTASGSTIGLSGGNNITLSGTNGSQIIISAANQSNQTVGLYALGNTTQNSSTTLDARTMSLNGLGAMTVGYSNGSIQMSAPATSSISGTGRVSISVNGSTISIGVPNASTLSGYNPYADQPMVVGQVGQGTLQFEPEYFPNFQCDRILFPMHNTNSSNSSGSHTVSYWIGIYTRNASTLSLYSSVSASTAVTHSGTAGSYSLYSGIRHFTIGMTNTFTEGEYWLGFLSRTTSGGANGSYSNILGSNVNSAFQGFFGSSNNTTMQFTLGQGVYTATTSAMPASVGFSQIRGSDSMALRPPIMLFASSTV